MRKMIKTDCDHIIGYEAISNGDNVYVQSVRVSDKCPLDDDCCYCDKCPECGEKLINKDD
jgi:hypothetical protein